MSVPTLNEIAQIPELPPSAPAIWANPVLTYVNSMYQSVSQRRSALGLPSPGTIENINKEVSKDVFLTPYFFTGLRADVSKSFSMNPAFQVSHSLSMGSPVLPSYAFAAFYATDNAFLHGNFEGDKSLSGRAQFGWNPANTSKANFQIAPGQPAMLQLEHDFLGSDFSLNFKALNPSLLSGSFTGVLVGSLFQSLTSHLSLGLEAMYSSQSSLYPPDAAVSYYARYATPNWIASAQVQATGSITASFWRKVADKVEAGIESTVGVNAQQAMMMGTPPTLEGVTTIGAKYEFRQSMFRGQVDSNGKVSCLVERRVLPVVSLTFAGELDQFKNQARVGLGLQLEAGGEEVFEQQQMMEQQQQML
ncbi:Mitochondrial import receptor subunit TOM40 [Wickerhamiella sorbophila]|uniref:Translocase of outer membrane 40 kDa subunit n=1 Tax=Wickerhamiella sorbophila TaxID=45607 RepID=A0A2T0FJR2_9ASCO|nr:Mitochondrial import receptor subunit TOM40 [Wickerhamiella sorbophila]PRT55205.1 Mitochondrial import receptor subunit TOM40 [Wickerhamiella sorbophila]